MRKGRKHYSAEEKVAILRVHLLDKVPVSDMCEETGLRPRDLRPATWQSADIHKLRSISRNNC
jgi:transposase-like protein